MRKRMETGLSDADARCALQEAQAQLVRQGGDMARRRLLRGALTLGGLAALSGCDLQDGDGVERALGAISVWNDRVQAWLFDPTRLAPVYAASQIVTPFPFNAFYGEDEVPRVDPRAWQLELSGLVAARKPWSLLDLLALPQERQITRHICVEGWSAIGSWGGVPLGLFLRRVGADLGAKYVAFQCTDGYHTSIDMASALHPQTILALTQDGKPLPPRHGFPMKLRIPTKLGYKNPKHIHAMHVTNSHPGGYWEDQGYNWFGGS